MRARDPGTVSLEDDSQRVRRLRARYRERASKLRSRAVAMISADTRRVMLGIADYFQRMADRLEARGGAPKAIDRAKPTKVD
jgi:hypothetical protein